MKSLLPRERLLASGLRGIGPFPMPLVRVVAICELTAYDPDLHARFWLCDYIPAIAD